MSEQPHGGRKSSMSSSWWVDNQLAPAIQPPAQPPAQPAQLQPRNFHVRQSRAWARIVRKRTLLLSPHHLRAVNNRSRNKDVNLVLSLYCLVIPKYVKSLGKEAHAGRSRSPNEAQLKQMHRLLPLLYPHGHPPDLHSKRRPPTQHLARTKTP